MWKDGGLDLGNQWNYGAFGFYYDTPYTVLVQATTGTSEDFIALDDVYFKESQYCSVVPDTAITGGVLPLPQTTTRAPTSTPVPSVYDCNFETGFCNWKNDVTKPLNWTRIRGSTSSIDTGPPFDHT
jgi:hypothetical protein